LALPEYQPDENPENIKNDLLANQEEDEEFKRQKEEAERKRLEIKRQYDEMLKVSEKIQIKRGSMRFLRVMVRVIIILLRIHKDSVKEKLKKRD
jgi:hypothetical protein